MKVATILKVIAVYDNNGSTIDRYTVVFDEQATDHPRGEVHTCLCLSANPTQPNGMSTWGDFWAELLMLPPERVEQIGIGKRINFVELPEEIKQHVKARVEVDGDLVLAA